MRKSLTGLVTATALAAAVLVGLPTPAHAATAWFVRIGGNAGNNCTSAATACPRITDVLAKGTFAAGDTIDVGPGTFTEHPVITKAVTITGAGASTTPNAATVTTINGGGTAAVPINTFQVIIPVANPNQAVAINNLSITGGLARLGGGIQLQAGDLSLTDDVVYNNTAGSTTLGSGSTGGGAIATFGKILGASSTLSLTRTTLTGNKALPIGTASVPGAAVFLLSPMTAVDSTISDNVLTAGTSGGTNAAAGIYMSKLVAADTTSLDADHTTFSGNVAGGSSLGGAIGANSGPPITIRNNSLMTNNAAADGGAIFTTGPSAVTINSSTLSTNVATFQGGGVFMQQTAGTDAPTLTTSGATISGNTAPSAGGGVILYPGVTGSFTGGSFDANRAPFGGALYVVKGASATATGTAFTSNTATATTAATTGWGGAIYSSGTLNVVGGSFATNIANGVPVSGTPPLNTGNGGAIVSNGALSVTGATNFTGNRAIPTTTAGSTVSGWGGSIYTGPLAASDAPTTTINDATFAGGGAPTNAAVGGGVAVAGNLLSVATPTAPVLNANHDTFSALIATFGSGLFQHAGTATISNSTFTASPAGSNGGAIAIFPTIASENPVMNMSSSVMSNNVTNATGGAATVYARGVLNLSSSTIDSNTSFLGGGIYVVEGGTANVDTSTLNNNTATGGAIANGGDGGGVFNAGTLNLTRSTLSNNKAIASTGSGTGQPARGSGFGGGVYAGSATNNAVVKTTIDSSTLNGNSANTASALINWTATGATGQTNPVSITNSTISNNFTTTGSGSIVTGFPISIASSTIANNTANIGGQTGSIYFIATSRIAGTIVSANTLGGCGLVSPWVVPTDGGYNEFDTGDTTCGFTAVKHDINATAAVLALGSLAANGGPTKTRLPGNSSPVINVIPSNTATGTTDAVSGAAITLCTPASVDQRGNVRPSGDSCDIGAVEVTSSAPTLTGPSADTYTVNVAGGPDTFTATGIPTPHLTITGALPAGVMFSDNGNGVATIAGTPASGTGGLYPVTITAANGASPNATKSFTLTVNEGPTLTGPSSATYLVGSAGTPQTFTATSNPTASLSETGALPAGVTFVDNGNGTATLSGTPNALTGGVYPIVVKASNGVGTDPTLNFTLTVNEAPSISGPTALVYTAGTAIAPADYTTTGFPDPALSATGLPAGLTFTDNGDGTATLSGTPAAGSGGVHNAVITATNSTGSAILPVSVTVNEAPQISGPTSRFCQILVACGPDTFTTSGYPVSSLGVTGALPLGVGFIDNGDGTLTISGTPAADTGGVYPVMITATNIAGSAMWAYTLTVGEPPTVSGPSMATYTVGTAGPTLDYTTTGFPTPTLSAVGLPSGVTLTDNGDGTASIDGIAAPLTGGIYNVTITATNGIGAPATAPLTLTVNEAPSLAGSPTEATYVAGSAGTPQTFTSTGFPAAGLAQSGELPDGVTFVDNGDGTATLSGTPGAHTGGVYPITVTATNSSGTAIWLFTLTVNEAPTVSGDTSARFEIDGLSTVPFTTTGFPTPGLTVDGDLPSGVGFFDNGDGTGSLTGTPDSGTEGVYALTIRAANGVGSPATLSFTLTVVSPVIVTTGDLTNAALGAPYNAQLTAIGGQPPYTWSLISGSLPAGLSLSAAGVLSGTPSGPTGTYGFTVRAKDSLVPDHFGTKLLSLTVVRGSTQLTLTPAILQLSPLKLRVLTLGGKLLGGPQRQPLPGETIAFYAGHTKMCTAVTNAAGKATCDITATNEINTVINIGYFARYLGSALWQPADSAAGLIS